MKVSEGKLGRVFVLRLDEGDAIPDSIERFAAERHVNAAQVTLLGAVGSGEVVAGPRDSRATRPQPMLLAVDGVHEVLGIGLLAPDEKGAPRLHVHGALGRAGTTLTGCLRPGVNAWFVIEVIVTEIVDDHLRRLPEGESGLSVLNFGD